jgi:ATP-dependent exoDNAse (exonuclease V) beta subunit
VHAAIAAYLRARKLDIAERDELARAELIRSLEKSHLPRGDTFTQMTRHARACLDAYLGSELLHRETVAIEEDFKVMRTIAGKELLLKGKVDAVFKGEHGEIIVDFKTASKIDKKDHAKFERQLAFYDLLLRENGHETTDALIIQIGDETVVEHPIVLTNDTRAELATTLDAVLTELLQGTWRRGERSRDDADAYDDLLTLFEN